jgi:hypothetical protein
MSGESDEPQEPGVVSIDATSDEGLAQLESKGLPIKRI